MASQEVKTKTKKTKTRVKKDGSDSDYMVCNMCHGDGIQKKPGTNKKKKKKS